MAAVRIKVGASVDSSVRLVFRPLIAAAKDARRQVARTFAGAGKDISGPFQRAGKEAATGLRQAEKAAERMASSSRSKVSRAQKDMERGFREIGKVAEREFMRAERASRSAATAFARRTSHRTTRFLAPTAPLLGFGARAGRDILRGAGVQTNLGSTVASIGEQEDLAAKISIKAFRPGEKGPSGQRFDPNELVKKSREIGGAAGIDPGELMKGLFAFTSQSGDLEAGLKLWEDMAKLAKGQGADVEQTFFAAGKVNSALEKQKGQYKTVEDRVAAVNKGMNVVVSSTKTGSVEMGKLAAQVPKLAGITGLFGGDPTRSLSNLVGLTQIAEQGQAKSAAIASTQVQNLALALVKPETRKRLEGKGIAFESAGGGLRDFKAILLDIVRAADKKGIEEITGTFRNKREFLPLIDLLNISAGAGGGQAGIDEVEAKFERLGRVTEDAQLLKDFEIASNTRSSRAQKFNVKWQEAIAQSLPKIQTAFEQLAPHAISLAEGLGGLAEWIAGNPWTALSAAIAASFARAALESTLRSGIEALLLGTGGAGSGGGLLGRYSGVGTARGAFGGPSRSLGLAAAAVTIGVVGKMIIDKVSETTQEGQRRAGIEKAQAGAEVANALVAAGLAIRTVDPETGAETIVRNRSITEEERKAAMAKLRQAQDELVTRRAVLKKREATGATAQTATDVAGFIFGGKTLEGIEAEKQGVKNIGELSKDIDRVERAIVALGQGELNVRVTNTMFGGTGTRVEGTELEGTIFEP
jgi:hypothetical protein